jgi:hypothetical protein
MKLPNSFTGVAIALSVAATAGTAAAGPARTAVGPYLAVVDRTPYAKPALPAIGAAGSTITDPVFGSTIRRVTDGGTRPGLANRSYRTPSSSHQNSWSAGGTRFYVVSTDGTVIPFSFEASTGAAHRIQPTTSGDGGLTLRFYIEPQFSYVNDSLIYGSVSGATLRTIDQYDFSSGKYTQLLDLDSIEGGLSGTYVGGISSSAGTVERIMTFFGGASQDHHHYVVVFDRANPSNRVVLDTLAGTLNGQPTATALGFSLHAVNIDLSGRYVMLYPTSADQSTNHAPQAVVWDIQTGALTPLTAAANPYGHDAFGYGVAVNKDCCTSTTWDAAQWQFRSLAAPLVTKDVITTVLSPKEVYLSDHPSWNNAQPDRLMPFISGLYRYGTTTSDWRAWDEEIVAVQTDAAAGSNPVVWRFAHHRSDVTNDFDATRTSFWYEPRPSVSRDGHWAIFTSNWEKTLGSDPAGDPGTGYRQDVFLLALTPGDGSSAAPTTTQGPIVPTPVPAQVSRPMMWIDSPGANATLAQPFTIAGWAIDAGATSDAGVDVVDVWAYPNPGSNTAPSFVGSATYGGARPDLASAFGAQFLNSGYSLTVRGLTPGVYQFAVFARSRISGTFNDVRLVTATVTGALPRMAVDIPGNNATAGTSFVVAGWAFDPNASSGSGVDAVHVWAYPNPGSGTAPRFVGAANVGYSRPDVAAVFGAAGGSSGYGLSAALPAGVYDLVVFAHSTVTGTFNQSQVVRVTVR